MKHTKREILFKLGNIPSHSNPDRLQSGWVKYTIHLMGDNMYPESCDMEYISNINFFVHSEKGKTPCKCVDLVHVGRNRWKQRNIQYTSNLSNTGIYKFVHRSKIKNMMEGKFYEY